MWHAFGRMDGWCANTASRSIDNSGLDDWLERPMLAVGVVNYSSPPLGFSNVLAFFRLAAPTVYFLSRGFHGAIWEGRRNSHAYSSTIVLFPSVTNSWLPPLLLPPLLHAVFIVKPNPESTRIGGGGDGVGGDGVGHHHHERTSVSPHRSFATCATNAPLRYCKHFCG